MKKHRKNDPSRRHSRPEDCHLALGAMRDPVAWAKSIEVDAADDRRWLQAHPKAKCRQRLISVREMQATGAPPGTIVTVCRGPHGSQIRTFDAPPGVLPPLTSIQPSRN
jgi:hypothetical protein